MGVSLIIKGADFSTNSLPILSVAAFDNILSNLKLLNGYGVSQGSTTTLGTALYSQEQRAAIVVDKSLVPSTAQYLNSSLVGSAQSSQYATDKNAAYDWIPVPAAVKQVTIANNPDYWVGVVLVTKANNKVSDSGWKINTEFTIDVSDYNETVWLAINTRNSMGGSMLGVTLGEYNLQITYTT